MPQVRTQTTKPCLVRARTAGALLIALALVAVSCTQRGAPPLETSSTIPQQFDQSRAQAGEPNPTATATATSPDLSSLDDQTVAAASTAASEPDDGEPDDSNPAPATPAPRNPDDQSLENSATAGPIPAPTFDPTEMSDAGVALGCLDATDIRRWLGTKEGPISEIAYVMPDQVWLCPQSPEVIDQLECFPDETEAILAELSTELSPEDVAVLARTGDSATTFCTNGDIIRLGINDILKRIEEDS